MSRVHEARALRPHKTDSPIHGHLIKDLLRCGGLPGRKVGVILAVTLAERSGTGWLCKVK